MQRLLSESTFVLGTSCAEGCCSAVVTAMRHGAIPIAAPQSGIDIGSFGIALAELTPSAVAAAMRVAITMSPEDVMRRREAAWRVTNAESSRAHLDGLLESYFDMVL
jgi:glycogen synthase